MNLRGTRVVAVLASLVWTQALAETHHEFWPELDVWHSITQTTRALLTAAGTRSRDDGDRTDAEFAFYLDHVFGEHISYRAGYLRAIDLHEDGGDPENRLVLDFNYRWHLGGHTLLADRTRLDLRDVGGDKSFRLRNRLHLEREMHVQDMSFTPYAHLEAYYDERFSTVSRWRLEAGSTFPQGHHLEWDVYAGWQRDTHPESQRVTGIGITLSVIL